MQTFSRRQILFTAGVTFVVSGVGGALFQHYLSGPVPEVTVTSVGFTGPQEELKLSDAAIAASQADAWGRSLKRFEAFDSLIKRDQTSSEILERLRTGVKLIDDWLRTNAIDDQTPMNPSGPPSLEAQLAPGQLIAHPIFKDNIIINHLHGAVRRRELSTPPGSLALVMKLPERLYTYDDGEAWQVFFSGGVSLPVPYKGVDQAQRGMLELLARSFARGHLVNIVYFSQYFKNFASSEQVKIGELQGYLREGLLPEARLAVSVAITNAGGRLVTFRPYFALRLLHEDFEAQVFVLSRRHEGRKEAAGEVISLLTRPGEEERGKESRAEPFLSTKGAPEYIPVPPNDSVTIDLVATKALGVMSDQVKKAYESGLLKVELVGRALDGGPIRSRPARFGARISDNEESELRGSVGK